MLEYLIDRGVTNVLDQFKSAKPRERVRRFDDHTEESQRVFDVSRFGKPDAAEFAERNSLFAQFYFQVERVRTGAKQHGDFVERHAILAQLFYALGDETRLLVFVARADHHRRLTSLNARIQAL